MAGEVSIFGLVQLPIGSILGEEREANVKNQIRTGHSVDRSLCSGYLGGLLLSIPVCDIAGIIHGTEVYSMA